MVHMAILRSPYAHANIRSIDTSAAKTKPGVIAVFVGADIPYNPLPMAWPAGGASGLQNNVNTPRVLATDDVKWTGEGVAAVIAETPEQAVDALEAIEVDWEPLPTVVDAEKATQPGAPQLHENAPNNIVFDWTVGDKAGTDAAIDSAEVVVRQRIINQRLIPNPMEVRGDIGWYNPGTDEYTVWMSSQTPHIQRLLLDGLRDRHPGAQGPLHQPRHRRRVRLEDLLLCRHGPRHVRQQGDRRTARSSGSRAGVENYQSTIHGRDHITYLEIGGTRDGEITGLRVKTYANLGGRLSTIGPGIPTTLYGRVLAGPYKFPNVHCEVIGVYTNTTFVDAYRGAGRPGGDVRRRAGDGPLRRRDRDGPGGRPPQELPAERRVPVRQPVGPRDRRQRREDLHRLRQLRAGPQQGPHDGRLLPARREAGGGAQRAASSSASASARTSRSAASRRRSGSAPSARAGARPCGSRPTSRSISPARSS